MDGIYTVLLALMIGCAYLLITRIETVLVQAIAGTNHYCWDIALL